MEEMPIQTLDHEKAALVSSNHSHRKLWRTRLDEYAVTTGQDTTPCFAFHSKELSELLYDLNAEISDVDVGRQTSLTSDDASEPVLSLLISKSLVAIHLDRVLLSQCIAKPAHPFGGLKPAVSFRGVPDIVPYNRMLISTALLKQVRPHFTEKQRAAVFGRLFYDHQTTDHPVGVGEAVVIDGLLGPFVAKELKCGRFTYQTVEEAKINT
jgi:hypothetical protein